MHTRPMQVKRVKPFMPFSATLMCIFIIGSMVSTNVAVLASAGASIFGAVTLLHSCGFFLGYSVSKVTGWPGSHVRPPRGPRVVVHVQDCAADGVYSLGYSVPKVQRCVESLCRGQYLLHVVTVRGVLVCGQHLIGICLVWACDTSKLSIAQSCNAHN